MHHLVGTRTVVGQGDLSVVLEIKGQAVRVKRRGMPDLYIPLVNAAEVGRFLLEAAQSQAGGAAAPA